MGKEQTQIKDDRRLVEWNVYCSKAVTQLSLSFTPGTNCADMKKLHLKKRGHCWSITFLKNSIWFCVIYKSDHCVLYIMVYNLIWYIIQNTAVCTKPARFFKKTYGLAWCVNCLNPKNPEDFDGTKLIQESLEGIYKTGLSWVNIQSITVLFSISEIPFLAIILVGKHRQENVLLLNVGLSETPAWLILEHKATAEKTVV